MPLSISTPTSAREREYRLGRTELLALISAIMALTAVAIDFMLPAFDDIREAFNLAEGSADTDRSSPSTFLVSPSPRSSTDRSLTDSAANRSCISASSSTCSVLRAPLSPPPLVYFCSAGSCEVQGQPEHE